MQTRLSCTKHTLVLLNHTKDAPLSVDGEDKFQIQSILLKESFTDIKEVVGVLMFILVFWLIFILVDESNTRTGY